VKTVVKWLLVVFVAFNLSAVGNGEESISIAIGEWPPYTSESLEHNGVLGRVITEAFALEGITVHFSFHPWKRAVRLAKNGEVDGTGPWRRKEKWVDSFIYSNSIAETDHVFFHLKSYEFSWNTYDDLVGVTLGGGSGYYYNKLLDDALKSGQLDMYRFAKDVQGLKMLLKERFNVLAINKHSGYYLLNKDFPGNKNQLITHHPKSLTPEEERPIYLLFSKKIKNSKASLQRFNKGLKHLKESGKYNEYFDDLRIGD